MTKERKKVILSRYAIIDQSTKPKLIQASLTLLNEVHQIFNNLLPAMQVLNLTPQSCEY